MDFFYLNNCPLYFEETATSLYICGKTDLIFSFSQSLPPGICFIEANHSFSYRALGLSLLVLLAGINQQAHPNYQ